MNYEDQILDYPLAPAENSLGEKLKFIVSQLPNSPEGMTLAEIRDLIGKDSLMLFVIFLNLIFLVPVSIPGVSTVFGAVILLIGLSRLFGQNLWLPNKIQERIIATDKLGAALQRAFAWVHRLEKISRPHRSSWVLTRGFNILNNVGFVLGALLLMAPFGFIPFSNTVPAVALLFFAIGFIQQDGISILLGHVANVVTIIYFTFLIAGGGALIYELFSFALGT
ncbi:MAG: exopolysaccharide biosynthesis protein [Chloroflexi bacterium]|nr:exopolysaccharide biosynthesis protein [Chloroflexota bacterium]